MRDAGGTTWPILPSCCALLICCALLAFAFLRDGSPDSRSPAARGDTPATVPAEETSVNWPKTVPAAVEYVLARLSEEQKRTLRQMKEEDLIDTHFGLGLCIRNNLGLWRGNEELLRATGEGHPDDASLVIVHAVWKKLQTQQASAPKSPRNAKLKRR